jgi:hypothetical protein
MIRDRDGTAHGPGRDGSVRDVTVPWPRLVSDGLLRKAVLELPPLKASGGASMRADSEARADSDFRTPGADADRAGPDRYSEETPAVTGPTLQVEVGVDPARRPGPIPGP